MTARNKTSIFFTVFCIAAILGTLTSATIVVAANVLVIFIFPVLILPYIAWAQWALFMRARGLLRPFPVSLAILITLVAVPLCAFLPYQVASYEMRLRAADTPSHPSLQVSKVVAYPFGNSMSGPGVVYYLEPVNDTLAALEALEDQLAEEGWNNVTGRIPSARGANISVLFSGPSGQMVDLSASWNRSLHEYEAISLRRNFSPVSPGLLLLVLLATALTSARYARLKGRKPNDANAG